MLNVLFCGNAGVFDGMLTCALSMMMRTDSQEPFHFFVFTMDLTSVKENYIPLKPIQEKIFGNEIDDNGVLIRTSTDKPPYFAVGFKSEKSNGKFRYVWLYKVRAKPLTENYATKEGTTINRQTGEVEWTAIKRTHDSRYQAVADEGENGFTAAMGETFLTSVYTPSFTP